MKNLFNTALIALSTAALISGCAKAANDAKKAVDHIGDEGNKKATAAQLAAGRWESPCHAHGVVWSVAGIKGSKTVYRFTGNVGKTQQLFSDENCNSLVGEATYTGTSTIGNPSAVDNSNILDLNYTKVEVKIADQATVDLLNKPLVPGCGHNDWAKDAVVDVTAAAGTATCPLIEKPGQVFDIAKTDGTTLHFGLADATHDKKSQNARPVALDLDAKNTYKNVAK